MALEALLLQWLVKHKFLSKHTPRSFNSFCSLMHWPKSFSSSFCFVRENETSCVFATLSLMRHLLHHRSISFRQRCSLRNVTFLQVSEVHRLMSSANCPARHLLLGCNGMSFT